MNLYLPLEDLIGSEILGMGSEFSRRLLQLLGGVSRQIDAFCCRLFFPYLDTLYLTVPDSQLTVAPADPRYGEGGLVVSGATSIRLPADLIGIVSLKEYDGTGTYSITWAASDFFLAPRDARPQGDISRASPYTSIEVNLMGNGKHSYFRAGRYIYKLDGKWGYCDVREDTGSILGQAMTALQDTLIVSDGTSMKVGWTCLLDDEQVYISAINNNTCSIRRGVNGTASTIHSVGAIIYRYVYPPPIVEACLMQTARLWTRRASGYGIGFMDTTQAVSPAGLDDDVKDMLEPYVKHTLKARVL